MKIGKYQWENNNNIQCNKYNMIWSVYNYIVLTSYTQTAGFIIQCIQVYNSIQSNSNYVDITTASTTNRGTQLNVKKWSDFK